MCNFKKGIQLYGFFFHSLHGYEKIAHGYRHDAKKESNITREYNFSFIFVHEKNHREYHNIGINLEKFNGNQKAQWTDQPDTEFYLGHSSDDDREEQEKK